MATDPQIPPEMRGLIEGTTEQERQFCRDRLRALRYLAQLLRGEVDGACEVGRHDLKVG